MIQGISVWHEFLATCAAIAATLSGLVFVAVSINLRQIIAITSFVSLALESLSQMLGAMVIALIALLPGITATWLSWSTLSLAVFLWTTQIRWQLMFMRQHAERPRRLTTHRLIRTQLACLPLAVASLLLYLGWPSAMYIFALGLLLSLMAGVSNAWVLLVKVAAC